MKKTLFLFLLCLGTLTRAQDVIITKDGDPIKAYRVEVAAETVFYQTSESSDAPIQRVPKSDILMIKFQDGRKLIIGEEEQQSNPEPQAQPQSTTDQDVSDPEANAALLQRYQAPVEYIGEPTESKAGLVLLTFSPIGETVLTDKNVEVEVLAGKGWTDKGKSYIGLNTGIWNVRLRVKNKSSKTLYLDLGNCFLIRGNESVPYFVPTTTSTTHGTTRGGSVNLGAVAGAMGIGGGVGTLASGINLGGSNSDYSTTTVIAQRIVAIPPTSTRDMGAVRMMNMYAGDNPFPKAPLKYNRLTGVYMLFQGPLQGGQIIDFDPSSGMMQFGFIITYAEDESQTSPHNLHATFGLSRLVGLPKKIGSMKYQVDMKEIDALVSPSYHYVPIDLMRTKWD